MATTVKAPPERRILVRLVDGTSRIVENVPGNAKITFGLVHAGGEKGWNRDYALRIYTSLSNQLAVFMGVVEFRDLSLNVIKQVKNRAASSRVKHDPNGQKVTAESAEVVEADWVPEEVF